MAISYTETTNDAPTNDCSAARLAISYHYPIRCIVLKMIQIVDGDSMKCDQRQFIGQIDSTKTAMNTLNRQSNLSDGGSVFKGT